MWVLLFLRARSSGHRTSLSIYFFCLLFYQLVSPSVTNEQVNYWELYENFVQQLGYISTLIITHFCLHSAKACVSAVVEMIVSSVAWEISSVEGERTACQWCDNDQSFSLTRHKLHPLTLSLYSSHSTGPPSTTNLFFSPVKHNILFYFLTYTVV